jgi:hypothetical protein
VEVLRESTFRLGGALTVVLGLAFAAGLAWAGAGADYFTAYVGAAFGVVLGSFFIYVGGAEARERQVSARHPERLAEGTAAEPVRPR